MVVRLRESAEAHSSSRAYDPRSDGLFRGHRVEPSGVSEIAVHLEECRQKVKGDV